MSCFNVMGPNDQDYYFLSLDSKGTFQSHADSINKVYSILFDFAHLVFMLNWPNRYLANT